MGKLIRLGTKQAYDIYNKVYTDTDNNYIKYIQDSTDNEKFYEGGKQQWTPEELDAQAERGQYTMTMNISKKAIDSMVGMFTANKPTMVCLPTKDGNEGIATIASELIDQSYRDSLGLLTIREVMFNAYRCNMGFAFVRHDESGKIIFEKLSYRNVTVDPNTTKALWEDAGWICVRKWVPIEEAKAAYDVPTLSPEFPQDWSSFTGTMFSEYDNGPLFTSDGKYVLILEIYKKIFYRNKRGILDTQIEKQTLIGYQYLWREMLPKAIKDYPIIPLYSTLSNSPYKFSEMHFLKDPQRYVNKMYNETIRSAQALSSGKVIVRTSDIPDGDIEAFANNWSLPGGVIEMNPGSKDPVVVHPDPLNSAYFSMYQNAVGHLHSMSLPADTMGYGESDSKNAGQDLQLKREMVLDTLKIPAGIFEAFLRALGRSILQHYQAYIPNEDILRITSGGKALETIKAFQAKGLDPSDEKIVMQYISKEVKENKRNELEVRMEVEEAKVAMDKLDGLADIIQDYETLVMDIDIVSDSYSPNYASVKYNIAERMVEKGALPPDVLLDLSPLPNKAELRVKVNAIRDLSSQVNQLSEALESANKTVAQREEEYRTLMKQSIAVKEQVRHESIYKDERAKSYVNKQAMAMDRTEKARSLEYQIKEMMLELNANKESLKGLTIEQIQNAMVNE